jgi:hypothetical protein
MCCPRSRTQWRLWPFSNNGWTFLLQRVEGRLFFGYCQFPANTHVRCVEVWLGVSLYPYCEMLLRWYSAILQKSCISYYRGRGQPEIVCRLVWQLLRSLYMSFFVCVFKPCYVFDYVSGCRARPLTAAPLVAWQRVGLVLANVESDIALECLPPVRSRKWHWPYARSPRSNSPLSAVMSCRLV